MTARKQIIPIFVPHLGCPNDCVFCNQRKISGSLVPATAQSVTDTLEKARQRISGEAELAFYGGSFTAIEPEQQEQLLGAARAFDFIKDIRVSTRPDKIDRPALDRLRRYGVTTVELGAQSMDDSVLRLSGRGHCSDDTRRAAKLVKEEKFTLILQMMTGLPGASAESDEKTARELCALAPDGVRIYPTVIVRDTPLYEMWQRGQYTEHTVEDAVELCAGLADIFDESGIPIIRLGLNPTDDLSGGEAAAGAYHPALGELVYSRRFLRRAEKLMADIMPVKWAEIFVNPGDVSKMTGHRRANITALQNKFALEGIKVKSRQMEPNGIEISGQL